MIVRAGDGAARVRVTWRHEVEGTIDAAKLAAAFPEERADFDGTDEEFVRESADIMGRDILLDAEGWLVGGISEDFEFDVWRVSV